jgi:GxxExxY protein
MPLPEEDITRAIIGAFFEVYNRLNYGFVECLYERAMQLELGLRGHQVNRQVNTAVDYKDWILGTQRIDMLVDDRVIVEIKATEHLPSTARQQLRSYLRSTNLEVGLLLHFGPEARFYREYIPNR